MYHKDLKKQGVFGEPPHCTVRAFLHLNGRKIKKSLKNISSLPGGERCITKLTSELLLELNVEFFEFCKSYDFSIIEKFLFIENIVNGPHMSM